MAEVKEGGVRGAAVKDAIVPRTATRVCHGP